MIECNSMLNRLTTYSFTALLSFTLFEIDEIVKESFPPKHLDPLPPQPGYKVFGYMGCPLQKISDIQKRERNLFFSSTINAPQKFALKRSGSRDTPAVLQIEIKDDASINPQDLWRDPQLNKLSYIPPMEVSYWPAIPPEIQMKTNLHLRVHHLVTCEVLQETGHWCRCIKKLSKIILG